MGLLISRRTILLLVLAILLTYGGVGVVQRQQQRCAAVSHPAGRRAAIAGASASSADAGCMTDLRPMRGFDVTVLFAWLISALAVLRSLAIDGQQWKRRQRAVMLGDTDADSLRE